MLQQGQLLKLKTTDSQGQPLWAYRYRVGGRGSKRVQQGGFHTATDAREALERAIDTLRRDEGVGRSLTLAQLVADYLSQHEAERTTIDKLRWLLAKAVVAFGDRPVGEIRSSEIAAWRMTIPEGHRFEATQALRQVLARAVVWRMLSTNPARLGVDNPQPKRKEQRPFESWAEVSAVADRVGPRYGPMLIFAAATGLRPEEWIALERRDVDADARVVYVRRAFTDGRLKCTKTEGSRRAVPLQAIALDALERTPVDRQTPLLFPSPRGCYLNLRNFRTRAWTPAQVEGGIDPRRRIYDLRHTFATFALRAGVSTFDLSRYMGASLTMIDRHYGHLARDGREHAIRLLDVFATSEPANVHRGKASEALQRANVHRVDAAWTSQPSTTPLSENGTAL